MTQFMVGTLWIVVCIRKCVGGRWKAEGRCRAGAGHVLEADGVGL